LLAGIAYAHDSPPTWVLCSLGLRLVYFMSFFGVDDYLSPHGRVYGKVEVRLLAESSLKPFCLGFGEIGTNIPESEIKRAISELGRIPG